MQVMLAWQNLPGQLGDGLAGLALGDLQVAQMPIDTHTARVDLSFSLAECFTEAGEPAGISGMVEFRSDVFDAASVEALVGRLQRVLAVMTAEPAGGCRRWMCSMPVSMPGWRSGVIGWC
ncbi:hxxPF-repeated domain protein [Mycobacterium xenopi 3993]|nr:hxxPF-repeated domain protein [Mycobacterium xenopi 3993]